MHDIIPVKKTITAEKAQKVLTEEGLEVSLEEAKLILEFLRILAKIVVKHYLVNHEQSRSIREGEYRRTGR
ncbi:hypothetical protein [Pedobacter sp.]